MDLDSKISQLWQYLNVKDHEKLIIQVFDPKRKEDVYIVVVKNNNLITHGVNKIVDMNFNHPFRLVKYVGPEGKHVIPSVEQLQKDEEMDY